MCCMCIIKYYGSLCTCVCTCIFSNALTQQQQKAEETIADNPLKALPKTVATEKG